MLMLMRVFNVRWTALTDGLQQSPGYRKTKHRSETWRRPIDRNYDLPS